MYIIRKVQDIKHLRFLTLNLNLLALIKMTQHSFFSCLIIRAALHAAEKNNSGDEIMLIGRLKVHAYRLFIQFDASL